MEFFNRELGPGYWVVLAWYRLTVKDSIVIRCTYDNAIARSPKKSDWCSILSQEHYMPPRVVSCIRDNAHFVDHVTRFHGNHCQGNQEMCVF